MTRDRSNALASWETTSLGVSCDIVASSMSYTDFLGEADCTDDDAVTCMAVKVSDMNLPGNEMMFATANAVKRLPVSLAVRKLVPRNAVVLPKRGAAIATNKKRLTTEWTVLDPNLIAIRPKKGIDPHYLFFWSQTLDLRRITDPGPTPQLNKKDLLPVSLRLPSSLSEQKQIAGLLWALRRIVQQQECLVAVTSELKRALMHKLFTQGIRGEDSKETEIGLMVTTWKMNRLGAIARISSGGTPSREVHGYWEKGTIPWVKTTEINYSTITTTEERITALGLKNSAAKVFPAGTLLLAMYGQGVTRGRVALLGIDAATNQACASITPHTEDEVSSSFLYYFLERHYESLRQRGHGANQANLSATLLKQFPVFYPAPSEQQQIVAALRSVDEKLEIHEKSRASWEALYRTLLHQLMSAEIRVHDLDLTAIEGFIHELTGAA